MRVRELAQMPLSFPTYVGVLGRLAAKAAQQLNLKMDWVANVAVETGKSDEFGDARIA
jgi:dihydrolipoamide dehydrogenase